MRPQLLKSQHGNVLLKIISDIEHCFPHQHCLSLYAANWRGATRCNPTYYLKRCYVKKLRWAHLEAKPDWPARKQHSMVEYFDQSCQAYLNRNSSPGCYETGLSERNNEASLAEVDWSDSTLHEYQKFFEAAISKAVRFRVNRTVRSVHQVARGGRLIWKYISQKSL